MSTPPKPGLAPPPGPPGADEVVIVERVQIDLIHRHVNRVAVGPVRPVALLDIERIVAMPVRPILGRERGRQLVLVRLEVIPVGKRPVLGSAELDDRVANDGLEGDEVAAVPGQEVPAAVLTLLPIGLHIGLARLRLRLAQISDLLPHRSGEPVDGAKELPARGLFQRPRLHRLDAARIPEDRIGPVAAQFPNIFADSRHVGLPVRSRAARGQQRMLFAHETASDSV